MDPEVSRAKFERELAQYRAREDEHLRRGWWMLQAEFPQVLVAFATAQLKPPAVAFGAVLDFTDYDLHPPSVRLVDPFTREPYKHRDLPPSAQLLRRTNPDAPDGAPVELVALAQSHGPDDVPFICLPGVREYHDHPAHSGDSWLLHRGGAEGTLHFVLETLYKYGVQRINSYSINMLVGLGQLEPLP